MPDGDEDLAVAVKVHTTSRYPRRGTANYRLLTERSRFKSVRRATLQQVGVILSR